MMTDESPATGSKQRCFIDHTISMRLTGTIRCGAKKRWILLAVVGMLGLSRTIFVRNVMVTDRTSSGITDPVPYRYVNPKDYELLDVIGSNCSAAFSGSAKNTDFTKTYHRWNNSEIIESSKNCPFFLEDFGMNRYPPPTQEEREFPIAFSIVFHTDFDQVLFLLRAVYQPQNIYCLHIDKKANEEMHRAVRGVVGCLPNVFVASTLEDVVYASFSRLQADLTCMKDALDHPVQWRYYINMVGQQFPLRSNLEMVRILKLFNGTNDVEGILGARRLEKRYQFKYGTVTLATGRKRMERKGDQTQPPPPHNLAVVKGSVFGTFSRDFVRFVHEDKRAADLLAWSRDIYSPDEYVWSTLHHSQVLRAPGGYTAGKADGKPWLSTYANWGENPCAAEYVRGICIFSAEDLPLLKSRKEFFANKFYIGKYPNVLHCLDKFVYNLTVTRTVRDLDYYKSLPFVTAKKGVN